MLRQLPSKLENLAKVIWGIQVANFNVVTRESIVPADVERPESVPAVAGRFAGGGVLLPLPGTPNPKEVIAACRLDIKKRSIRLLITNYCIDILFSEVSKLP